MYAHILQFLHLYLYSRSYLERHSNNQCCSCVVSLTFNVKGSQTHYLYDLLLGIPGIICFFCLLIMLTAYQIYKFAH